MTFSWYLNQLSRKKRSFGFGYHCNTINFYILRALNPLCNQIPDVTLAVRVLRVLYVSIDHSRAGAGQAALHRQNAQPSEDREGSLRVRHLCPEAVVWGLSMSRSGTIYESVWAHIKF